MNKNEKDFDIISTDTKSNNIPNKSIIQTEDNSNDIKDFVIFTLILKLNFSFGVK